MPSNHPNLAPYLTLLPDRHACAAQPPTVHYRHPGPADAAAFFAQWGFWGGIYETTDNAYVQGEIPYVSIQLGARIDQVQNNQHVHQGDCW